MRMQKIITALILLVGVMCHTVSAQQKLGANVITFKKEVFEQNLINAVAPTTVGYQFVLIKDGQVISERFGGNARRGNDGNLKVNATTAFNIGSLFKFISGTTMLNLMEKKAVKMGQTYKNRDVKTILGTPIWGEFPKVWLDVIPPPTTPSPQQRNIEFRQLLQHRSGFDNAWNKEQAGNRPLLGFLKDGFLASQYDKRDYCNVNFVLVGHLLPLLERHNLNYDLDIATNGKSQAEADKYVRTQTGLRMDALMRERIWSKMTPTFSPTCDAKNDILRKYTAAYGYTSTSDNDGTIVSSIETQGYCGGQGGYYMSARDFANYIKHFSQTDLIVSKDVRDMMYSEEMSSHHNDRLVWTEADTSPWSTKNFNVPRIAWSNGVTGGTRTVLLRLPQNYYLILFSNTSNKDASVQHLYDSGLAAFRAGMDHNFQ